MAYTKEQFISEIEKIKAKILNFQVSPESRDSFRDFLQDSKVYLDKISDGLEDFEVDSYVHIPQPTQFGTQGPVQPFIPNQGPQFAPQPTQYNPQMPRFVPQPFQFTPQPAQFGSQMPQFTPQPTQFGSQMPQFAPQPAQFGSQTPQFAPQPGCQYRYCIDSPTPQFCGRTTSGENKLCNAHMMK